MSFATPHSSVAALKASVEQEWAIMSEDFMINSCKAFRSRIEAMVSNGGDHFEKQIIQTYV